MFPDDINNNSDILKTRGTWFGSLKCNCGIEGNELITLHTDNLLRLIKRGCVPFPQKIIYNGPATIILWDNGDKTVVKCSEADTYDRYTAFCIAVVKYLYGNNSRIKSIIRTFEQVNA